jgi:transcriptional regulator with XRE-family HTH domain
MMWKQLDNLMWEKHTNANQLAQKLGLSSSTFYTIKSGDNRNPSFKLMCRVADALGVSVAELRPEGWPESDD